MAKKKTPPKKTPPKQTIEEEINDLFAESGVDDELQVHPSQKAFLDCQQKDNQNIKKGVKKYHKLLVLNQQGISAHF